MCFLHPTRLSAVTHSRGGHGLSERLLCGFCACLQKVSGDWADPANPDAFIQGNAEFLALHPILYMSANSRGDQTNQLNNKWVPGTAGAHSRVSPAIYIKSRPHTPRRCLSFGNSSGLLQR